ncbi:alpha-mannosidase At3g26720 isoform X1 [Physcomitrium patens]|uniref:Alpha-mannosidase n=2 Tax=Physcomitrium patens TaxID=3218 RepID=A0A2K1KE22_PHYPA|nr:alpha-mannosidase At3g26720-like isoform X1 [Physcomitrium patens]PNR52031.1 hypothetical protein PHYPA_008405 [Physcomitrium patens]|eukprot:XP_024378993.1 alpha-mannosidase At3g26720-like isoform X1 [Physcomitrella patens]
MGSFETAILLLHCILACQTLALEQPFRFAAKAYNTSGSTVEGKINVHLVSHTHDDVGWLKTVDQYYVGSNNSIAVAAVQYVLDSVVTALQQDPNRKFIYVEQAFFQRWWRQQSPTQQKIVEALVDSGQLEFINGGFCMHDEATTHYVDMIDQTTLGHRFIKKQFGKIPRIAWQIDPFGHSAVQAYLLGAEMGFDGLFFGRADYQDKINRQKERTMEVIWRGSKSLGESAQIFTGLMTHHYDPPHEFQFEIKSETSPIQDDPSLYGYNLPEKLDLFVEYVTNQSKEFRTHHIMWAMGEDFSYGNANTWFKQIDKLIHYANMDGRVNAFYSTPSMYLDAVHAANATWHLKTDDYFPYSDCPHCFWTGYFTSRPALKGYVRKLSALLQAARQVEFLVGKVSSGPNTDSLEEAVAILQHHDGVSGTERQHVADDYAARLSKGQSESEDVFNKALASLISTKAAESKLLIEKMSSTPGHRVLMNPVNSPDLNLVQCNLLNVSYCPPTEVELKSGRSFVVVAYNPLGWEREDFVRVPVSSSKIEVIDAEENEIPSQLIPITEADRTLRDKYVNLHAGVSAGTAPKYFLVFAAAVPPLGYNSFIVRPSSASGSNIAKLSSYETRRAPLTVHLKSSQLHLTFSKDTGLLTHMSNKKTGVSIPVEQSYCWYNGSSGVTEEDPHMASGAYLFRPNTSECFPLKNFQQIVTVFRGPLVEEVHQQFSPWASQVIRVYKNAEQAEVQFTVGPIPIDDSNGKEIVTKFTTPLRTEKTFYTDSNGRDFLKRVRDFRPDWNLEVKEPVAGNYYPLNLGIYMKDSETDVSVLVDRALGAASTADGQLEIMLHRRLLYDDHRGVGEALNETVCGSNGRCEGLTVLGSLYININPSEEASQWRRIKGQQILMPLQLAFSVLEDGNKEVLHSPKFSAFKSGYELPQNVALITLQELDDRQVLLRLANIFEVDESEQLSKMATVYLPDIFPNLKIKDVVELSLSANQKKSHMKKLTWTVEGNEKVQKNILRGRPLGRDDTSVEIAPMEIRTFLITL